MMRIATMVIVISFLITSCSSLIHKSYKIQSDNRLRKTEHKNFVGDKALTQWWYFDFFLDDGSVLVLMFVPHHWWTNPKEEGDAKTLICTSYLKANGELITAEEIINSNEVIYEENSVKSSYLEIIRSHDETTREYTINFFFDEIQGSAQITSDSKAFSPLPTGSMGSFGTRHILRKGKGLGYRYAAHVPQGDAIVNLDINDTYISLAGKAYNEQGWFSGQAHQMGDGWVWFHFVSENINLFGARSFFFLEMNGERIIGGLNSFNSRCVVSDTVMFDNVPNFLMGGNLNFRSSKTSFEVAPLNKTNSRLIYIPSDNTDQVWVTVLQPSIMNIQYKGQDFTEEGRLLIETCGMSKTQIQYTPNVKLLRKNHKHKSE
jgi:hypothetical protein